MTAHEDHCAMVTDSAMAPCTCRHHTHQFYPSGDADPRCYICRERKSASEIDTANAQALAEHTARAVQIMRDEIARIEREAEEDDRFHYAEWKDGA